METWKRSMLLRHGVELSVNILIVVMFQYIMIQFRNNLHNGRIDAGQLLDLRNMNFST